MSTMISASNPKNKTSSTAKSIKGTNFDFILFIIKFNSYLLSNHSSFTIAFFTTFPSIFHPRARIFFTLLLYFV